MQKYGQINQGIEKKRRKELLFSIFQHTYNLDLFSVYILYKGSSPSSEKNSLNPNNPRTQNNNL